MYSGKNGATLFTFIGDLNGDRFGSAVAGVGDLNGDGYPEIVVGATQPVLLGAPGYVKVFSGKDGAALKTIAGNAISDTFGAAVSAAGDIDGDGVPDFLVGAPQTNSGGTGYVKIYSGRDWSVLHTFTGSNANERFGTAVHGGTDLDADGRPDVLVGAPATNAGAFAAGTATVFSGSTFGVLWSLNGDSAGDRLGTAVAFVGDFDHDGRPDFAVGAPFDNGAGSVQMVSGKTGKQIIRFDGDAAGDEFGAAVAGLGDINDDGHADVVVGAPADDNTATDAGSARVFSGKTLTLWTDTHELSLLKVGTQTLTLEAGAAHAFRSYQIFGSASGATPGTSLPGVHVPLNIDAYTEFAIAFVNTPMLQAFRGKLYAAGRATAAFQVPAGLPALADMTLRHAFLVYDGNGIHMASNAVTLRLSN